MPHQPDDDAPPRQLPEEKLVISHPVIPDSRYTEAAKQLICGGTAGCVAKTVTAPFSRLTILFQVHSLVTTRGNRPKFAMSLSGGIQKIIERGGIKSFWKGNMTSVLHRFPYSAINFFVYEHTLDVLTGRDASLPSSEPESQTQAQLVRRLSKITMKEQKDVERYEQELRQRQERRGLHEEDSSTNSQKKTHPATFTPDETPALHKFISGATAGTMACLACYPLDLVRTRLATELEGFEHYRGISDCFTKIYRAEGLRGFYSGIAPTLLVAIPNFGVSYTVYGSLKEHLLDDDLFYNLRKIDSDSGENKLGMVLTLLCGASSGILATLITFPMDTIRRRMQVQNLHVLDPKQRLTSRQQFSKLFFEEGLSSLYRGLTPEILKVVPMVGTMFVVYEWAKGMLRVTHNR
jgi:solute carrier family 25 phosphate transporter 23/24/25/41